MFTRRKPVIHTEQKIAKLYINAKWFKVVKSAISKPKFHQITFVRQTYAFDLPPFLNLFTNLRFLLVQVYL